MPGCAGNETREAGEVAWPLEEQQAELNGQQAMTRPDGKSPHRFLPSHSILLMERVISSRLSERDGGSELSDGSDMEAFTAMGCGETSPQLIPDGTRPVPAGFQLE